MQAGSLGVSGLAVAVDRVPAMLRANSRPLLLDLAWLPGCRAGDDIQAAGSAQARKRAVSAPRLAALVRVGGRPDTSGWPGVRGTVAAR
jgi:hypothetical protein